MGTLDTDRGLEIARSIFREASDAFFVFDPRDGSVVDVNPAGLRMSGFDRRDVLALRIQDLFTAEGDGLQRLIDALQKTQYFHSREGYALTRKSGDPVAINVSVSRIHTRPESLGLVVARDVSELRRTREGLEQFFRHSPALFAVLGKDGRIRTTNPAWEESLGYDPDQLTGRVFADLIHPEDRALASAAAGPRSDAKPELFEARFLRADGDPVWLSWCAGTIGGVTYAVALDTTSRKEAEALRSAKRRGRDGQRGQEPPARQRQPRAPHAPVGHARPGRRPARTCPRQRRSHNDGRLAGHPAQRHGSRPVDRRSPRPLAGRGWAARSHPRRAVRRRSWPTCSTCSRRPPPGRGWS